MANWGKSANRRRRKSGNTNRRASGTKGLTKRQVERLSKDSARGLVRGTNRLRSRGYSGWYKSQRLNKYYNYRSKLERRIIEILDSADDLVQQFDCEKIIIPYFYKGAQLNYVPDVILKTRDGKVYILEVKYTRDFDKEKNKEKWDAAKDFAVAYGATFKVISEKDVDNLLDIIAGRHILTEEEKRYSANR